MSASEKHGPSVSVLDEAAKHESALMAQVRAADKDAQRLVAQAHEQAAAHLLEQQHQVERDIAEMRRTAAAEREREEAAIAAAAEQKVADIRAKAAPNVDKIRQLVVSRILPAGVEGVNS